MGGSSLANRIRLFSTFQKLIYLSLQLNGFTLIKLRMTYQSLSLAFDLAT